MRFDKNKFHFVSATVIIVNSEGKFLIARRADWEKAFPSKWTVPGGKLEVLDYVLRQKDTSAQWYNVLEDLARREVREEVGLEIKNFGYVASLAFIRPDEIPVVVLSYSAELADENVPVVLDKSLTDYKWVTLEEARNYDLIDGIYEELEMLDKKLKTGKIDFWKKNNSKELNSSEKSFEDDFKRAGLSY